MNNKEKFYMALNGTTYFWADNGVTTFHNFLRRPKGKRCLHKILDFLLLLKSDNFFIGFKRVLPCLILCRVLVYYLNKFNINWVLCSF